MIDSADINTTGFYAKNKNLKGCFRMTVRLLGLVLIFSVWSICNSVFAVNNAEDPIGEKLQDAVQDFSCQSQAGNSKEVVTRYESAGSGHHAEESNQQASTLSVFVPGSKQKDENHVLQKSCKEISASEIKKLSPGALIVDLRHENQFEKYSIPGSLNIPYFSLKTKSFMSDRQVVLIDDGFEGDSLYTQCEELARYGFSDVNILVNGIYAWIRSNHFSGKNVAGKDIVRSSAMPPEIIEGLDSQDILIINQSAADNGAVSELFQWEDSQIISAGLPDSAVVERMQNKNLKSILVIGSSDAVPPEFYKWYYNESVQKVQYLKGGIGGYQTYIKYKKAMLSNMVARNAAVPMCSVK